MDQIEKQERKREAQRRLRSQRRRAGLLRSRVIVVSLVSFALLWGVVFVQMATGNDPVLDSSARVATSQRTRASKRTRGSATEIPAEADASSDSEEAPAAEVVETAEPEGVEAQPEAVEAEVAEPEPVPAAVTTSQS